MSRNSSSRIYVGNLPSDVREEEIDDLFYKYGRIVDIDLKLPPRSPAFCFVEFDDARDAEDAVRGRDGTRFDGHTIRVELAHGGRGLPPPADRHGSYSSSGRSGRAEYRVYVTKLPWRASWQDLKDHMRQAGDVSYAQVFHEAGGTVGIVDYTNLDDKKYALRKLDDSEFRNRYSRSFIRVHQERVRSASRRSYSRSRSRSRSASRAPSRSRSRSGSKSHERSGSRSPSRSPPTKASKG